MDLILSRTSSRVDVLSTDGDIVVESGYYL
jgi:hypothetical protein